MGGSEPSGPALPLPGPSPHFCPRCFYLGIRVTELRHVENHAPREPMPVPGTEFRL